MNAIKNRFYQLVGRLSIEEVTSNLPLIERIEIISSLLSAITSQTEGLGGAN